MFSYIQRHHRIKTLFKHIPQLAISFTVVGMALLISIQNSSEILAVVPILLSLVFYWIIVLRKVKKND